MKKSINCLALFALFSTLLLAGCGGDEQPKEGSADIVKANPPLEELPPEFKERAAEKMKRGGYDPNNPLARGQR